MNTPVPEFLSVELSLNPDFTRLDYQKKVKANGGCVIKGDTCRLITLPNTVEGRRLMNELCDVFHQRKMIISMSGKELKNEFYCYGAVEWNGIPEYDYVSDAMKEYELSWRERKENEAKWENRSGTGSGIT